MRAIKFFLQDKRGSTAIEYCVIGSLISILIITGAMLIGNNLTSVFYNKLAAALP